MEKTCTRCITTKPADQFGKHTRSSDGLQCWCKACKREHYQANRVEVLTHQSEYRAANRREVLARKRGWYQANSEEERERNRQYRADNKVLLKEKATRRYHNGGRPADCPWPDRPIAYSTAHARVKATYGSASRHLCVKCGHQAHAWSYDHSDPNPLMHQGVGLWKDKAPVPYSADPSRYEPMCRSCHVKRDRYEA